MLRYAYEDKIIHSCAFVVHDAPECVRNWQYTTTKHEEDAHVHRV